MESFSNTLRYKKIYLGFFYPTLNIIVCYPFLFLSYSCNLGADLSATSQVMGHIVKVLFILVIIWSAIKIMDYWIFGY